MHKLFYILLGLILVLSISLYILNIRKSQTTEHFQICMPTFAWQNTERCPAPSYVPMNGGCCVKQTCL